jgi:hypothetical protein
MKRLIILFLLVVVATASTFGHEHDRTGFIKTGQTMLDKPMAFTAADAVATGDSTLIIVTSEQVYPTKQNLYSTLTTTSGSPSVTIKLFGKCFSGDAYVQIGSTITWTSSSNNPINISAVTPNQYRYFKAEYICGGTGGVKITAFELKLWFTSGLASSGTLTDGTATINSGAIAGATTIAASGRITGTGGATITGAATNINASSNFATNIGTGTTDAAVSIGGGSNTVAVNSTSWDISTAGVASGFTGITTTGVLSGGALITSGVDTCRGSQTAKSVAGKSLLRCDGTCTLYGLTGGVSGQFLRIINTSATTLTLVHNGTTTQKIMISGGSNKAITTQYGGVTMVFDGTNWYVTGNGQ